MRNRNGYGKARTFENQTEVLLANVELLRDEINSKNMSIAIFEAIEQQLNLFSNDFRFKIKEAKNSAVSSKKNLSFTG